MFEVDVQANVEVEESWIALIKTAVQTTLTLEKTTSPQTVSIVLTNDEQLHQLNLQFRQQDKPTDILSFPATKMHGMANYLGDIVISVAYAQRHAKQEGHTLAEELQLLGVHGTLHLLGYDDINPEAKKEMWLAQTAVLRQLGLNIKV